MLCGSDTCEILVTQARTTGFSLYFIQWLRHLNNAALFTNYSTVVWQNGPPGWLIYTAYTE